MDTVCWDQREINYDNPRDGPRFLAHWHQSSKCYSYCRQASIKEIIYKEKWLTTLIESMSGLELGDKIVDIRAP